jgi:hypothetical protein
MDLYISACNGVDSRKDWPTEWMVGRNVIWIYTTVKDRKSDGPWNVGHSEAADISDNPKIFR